MDSIEKFLAQLSPKERALYVRIFADIFILSLRTYDVKSLQGQKGVFRLRKGKIRILFVKDNGRGIVIHIAYRKDVYR